MQKLALAGDINSAWRFLQKGIRQHSATFQASTSHRKYPPSEATIYWQDQKEQARRLGRELLLVASLYDDPALLDVLRGWHFVAHRQYSDKQLGKSKRIDQETARKHWNEELIRAKARGDARTAQRLIYKIAGTGISKHKQFSWQTPSTNEIGSDLFERMVQMVAAVRRSFVFKMRLTTLVLLDWKESIR